MKIICKHYGHLLSLLNMIMPLLAYQDDDLKDHDIMTLHFINNEKLLPLHDSW